MKKYIGTLFLALLLKAGINWADKSSHPHSIPQRHDYTHASAAKEKALNKSAHKNSDLNYQIRWASYSSSEKKPDFDNKNSNNLKFGNPTKINQKLLIRELRTEGPRSPDPSLTQYPTTSLTSKLFAQGAIQQQDYSSTLCAENGSCYGDISQINGRPKTIEVNGYYRKDGTYVRGHYRSR